MCCALCNIYKTPFFFYVLAVSSEVKINWKCIFFRISISKDDYVRTKCSWVFCTAYHTQGLCVYELLNWKQKGHMLSEKMQISLHMYGKNSNINKSCRFKGSIIQQMCWLILSLHNFYYIICSSNIASSCYF